MTNITDTDNGNTSTSLVTNSGRGSQAWAQRRGETNDAAPQQRAPRKSKKAAAEPAPEQVEES